MNINIFKRDTSISRTELEAYIGQNAYTPFYIKALDKYLDNPNSFNWCWPSFFISMYWFMYRKAVLPALILFLVNFALLTVIPPPASGIISIIFLIIMGLFGTNILFLTAEKEINKIKLLNPTLDESSILRLIGIKGGTTYLYPLMFYLAQVFIYQVTMFM